MVTAVPGNEQPLARESAPALDQALARALAYEAAARTPDPELPVLTIADLGILRQVDYSPGSVREKMPATRKGEPETGGEVVVTITPTYSGCPAMREIAAGIRFRLVRAGFARVTVKTQLSPAWTTDWVTEEGRRKLAANGIAPPPPSPGRAGPIPLTLGRRPSPSCPRCGSPDTQLTAQFSATACKSLHRCDVCGEPFEAVKPL